MSNEDNSERNFIEAKMIIQEFHDDPTVFIVGTAPFGKLWFDQDKITQQYEVLSENWHQEYGDKDATHCKKPRIVNVLLDESDPMFNRYRENIRDAQEKRQKMNEEAKEQKDKITKSKEENLQETPNEVVEETPSSKKTKKVTKKKKEKDTKDVNTTIKEESEKKSTKTKTAGSGTIDFKKKTTASTA